MTALHVAAFKGNLEVAETLIKHGVSLNNRDKLGYTELFRAVIGGVLKLSITPWKFYLKAFAFYCLGSLKMVNMLIENGANVTATDYDGISPLNYAISNGEYIEL